MLKNLITDEMVYDILKALSSKGEYSYDQDGIKITASQNDDGINFSCIVSYAEDNKKEADEAREQFYKYCATIDDDLFIKTCESINLEEVNTMVNSDKDYQEGITLFKEALKTVVKNEINNLEKELITLDDKVSALRNQKHQLTAYLRS